MLFHGFLMVFQWCFMLFQWFFDAFSMIFQCFSNAFSMIFNAFSMLFQCPGRRAHLAWPRTPRVPRSGARLSFTMGRRRVPKTARVGTPPPHSGTRLSLHLARPPGVDTRTPVHGAACPLTPGARTRAHGLRNVPEPFRNLVPAPQGTHCVVRRTAACSERDFTRSSVTPRHRHGEHGGQGTRRAGTPEHRSTFGAPAA